MKNIHLSLSEKDFYRLSKAKSDFQNKIKRNVNWEEFIIISVRGEKWLFVLIVIKR